MFCKQCGAQIPDGSSFCTSCGSPATVPEQPVQNPYAQPQQPVQNPYAQPQAEQPVQNPYAQQQAEQPVQNPYAQQQAEQPVQNPYAQQQAEQPVQNPYAQQQAEQPVQNPYAQQQAEQPVQNPYAQQQAEQPVQNPYAQQQAEQPVQNPYAQQQAEQPVQNPYAQQTQAFDANGQPVQYAPVQTAVVKTPMSPEKKKKFIIFGAIGGGVLIIAIILIVIFSSLGKGANSSCSAVIDTYFNSAIEGDLDELMSIIPPDVISYTVENTYYGDYSAFEDYLEDLIGLSSSYPSSIKVRYEIIEEKHCTDSETIMNITEKYCNRYEASAQITDIAKCKVKTYITYGNIGTPSIDSQTLNLIQIDGKWYADITGLCSSIGNSKFH